MALISTIARNSNPIMNLVDAQMNLTSSTLYVYVGGRIYRGEAPSNAIESPSPLVIYRNGSNWQDKCYGRITDHYIINIEIQTGAGNDSISNFQMLEACEEALFNQLNYKRFCPNNNPAGLVTPTYDYSLIAVERTTGPAYEFLSNSKTVCYVSYDFWATRSSPVGTYPTCS